MATSSKWPLGATCQRGDRASPPLVRAHQGCGHILPGDAAAAATPTAPRCCPLPLLAGAPFYKYRELRLRPSSPAHSPFFTPSHSLCFTTCKIFFSQSLRARKLCRKILHSRPPSQACWLFDLFSLT